jgi:endoglucanase
MKRQYAFYRPAVLALLLVAAGITGLSCNEGKRPGEPAGNRVKALSVKGTALVDAEGNSVVLKGVSLGWHNWWPRFYDKETVGWLAKDFNINIIRAAIGVEPDTAYLERPETAFRCLEKVVDAAIENDVYVIVDWHSHHIHADAAREFFTKAATRYQRYPNVIYELFNEPINDSWQEVKQYAEELIQTIRAIDKKNLILVGTPHWDQDVDLAANDPITGYDNVMYTLHFYAATHKQELRDRADYALSKGLPLFVSECAGMEATGNGPIDYKEWNQWLEWANRNKISWVAWSVADKDETCAMIRSKASPASHWTADDLKEWGRTIREELRDRYYLFDIYVGI